MFAGLEGSVNLVDLGDFHKSTGRTYCCTLAAEDTRRILEGSVFSRSNDRSETTLFKAKDR